MKTPWPLNPKGDMTPILEASLEAAMARHPSGKEKKAGVVLTAVDRCDRCPAAAGYRVWREDIGDLDFCMHHFRKNFPAMEPQGWQVIGGNPDITREG